MNQHTRLTGVCLILMCLSAPAVGQTLSFDPSVTAPVVKDFTVDLVLTGPDPVMGVDVVFTYDPAIVRLDAVGPGTFFTGWGLGVDHQFWHDPYVPAGTVHLSTAHLGAAAPTGGTFATFHFHALAVGISPLYFLSLTVRDGDNVDMIAEHSTGDRIIIDEAVPAEALSFSRLKALWR